MEYRQLSPLDRVLGGIDDALRAAAAPARASRPSPAAPVAETDLSAGDKAHAAGLMRVNHAGEVAAQGLYQGHAAVARDPGVEAQLNAAAAEELDHLGWCEERLRELGSAPSRLRPVWFAGAWLIGALSGAVGDKWSLGFIEETEKQVSEHLRGHLERLPEADAKSRAIVTRMREEEERHGANAHAAGAAELPEPVHRLMRLTAKIMTSTAYRF